MRDNDYTREEISSVWHCWNQMEVYLEQMYVLFVEADGNYMTDHKGKRYLDANSSLWNVNVGHRNPAIIEGILEQLNTLEHASLFLSSNVPSIELSKRLFQITGERYRHVFYTNSGSEATDTAIKIARQYYYNRGEAKRYKIISLERGYHGSTFGALSACGITGDKKAFGPLVDGFFQVASPDPFFRPVHQTPEQWTENCLNELVQLIESEGPDSIAAFIAEPIQASEGIGVLPESYLSQVRSLLNRYGILWISDEITTGFGRTGTWFSAEQTGCWPDMMLLAKGITSGYVPLGAVLVTEEIFGEFLGSYKSEREFVHGFTTSGHPVACSAALANIRYIEESGLIDHAHEIGKELQIRMQSLRKFSIVEDVQGRGLMAGIRLTPELINLPITAGWPPSMLVTKLLLKQGVLVHAAGLNAVVLAPPLSFELSQVEELIYAFEKVLSLLNNLKSTVRTS